VTYTEAPVAFKQCGNRCPKPCDIDLEPESLNKVLIINYFTPRYRKLTILNKGVRKGGGWS